MLNRLYGWYGKRVVRGVFVVVIIVIGVGVYLETRTAPVTAPVEEKKLPVVTIQSVEQLGSESGFSVVGTVRAVSEAKLQAEAGGRITDVRVNVGDAVSAGMVLATLENSAEQAALLQAEGAYESARVSSLQNGVSLDEAKTSVRNAYRNTLGTAEDVTHNLLDEFYTNPGTSASGFRIGGTGKAESYNDARRAIEPVLSAWSTKVKNADATLTEESMLTEANAVLVLISNLTAEISGLIADEDQNTQYTDAETAAYKARLSGARAALDGAIATIAGVRQGYDQAVLSASSDTSSQSTALLKSALGTLRGAQANFEKTLVRTPISGVVNALYLTEGEYINVGQPAVIVANNGSLEVSTALGEKDVERIKVGDLVRVDNTSTGTVTHIAPAIDPTTGKSEVKISVDKSGSLKNGSSVSVTFANAQNTKRSDGKIIVPLKALKLLASGSVVFAVSDTDTLVSLPVVLGTILGDSVEIQSGITLEDKIVIDARGLKEGDVVTVIEQ